MQFFLCDLCVGHLPSDSSSMLPFKFPGEECSQI